MTKIISLKSVTSSNLARVACGASYESMDGSIKVLHSVAYCDYGQTVSCSDGKPRVIDRKYNGSAYEVWLEENE